MDRRERQKLFLIQKEQNVHSVKITSGKGLLQRPPPFSYHICSSEIAASRSTAARLLPWWRSGHQAGRPRPWSEWSAGWCDLVSLPGEGPRWIVVLMDPSLMWAHPAWRSGGRSRGGIHWWRGTLSKWMTIKGIWKSSWPWSLQWGRFRWKASSSCRQRGSWSENVACPPGSKCRWYDPLRLKFGPWGSL